MKEMNKKNALKLIGKASLLAVVSFVLSCLFWLGLLIVVNMKEPINFWYAMMRVMLMACVHAHIAIGILYICIHEGKKEKISLECKAVLMFSTIVYFGFILLVFPFINCILGKYLQISMEIRTDFILQLAQLFILIINRSALLILIIWIVLELVKRKRLGL